MPLAAQSTCPDVSSATASIERALDLLHTRLGFVNKKLELQRERNRIVNEVAAERQRAIAEKT